MEYREEEYLQLSGLQHFAFCRRQWALAYIEMQWAENLRTVEGEILHEKAHDPFGAEKRGDLLISRGMAVSSRRLGISGNCDVVEFHRDPGGISLFGREGLWLPVPVEYKRGRPKEGEADELQLCAQAICLEEMLACSAIPKAYLYYGETARRHTVELNDALRQRVEELLTEMHDLARRQHTPKGRWSKGCNACSLKNICLPRLCKEPSAAEYIRERLEECP
ncbi:CRISPR-associated protein Cas4 [Bittarella massiliensis]|uniref:CRISPR-associated protein Cas4 n=1 Tax=Bittarella massiliensis (ex Durand et al. 2017) TaxID=1720313 RepID=UPI00163BBBBE|nr:CRISPR-associated protein Cas4 [Bittarella massiliensis (ex Durand et al. 2017)]MBC2871887.1 CRISPR-associated protein Cas4 [Bittarella massiliensis (ex Durand et al. 2017)]